MIVARVNDDFDGHVQLELLHNGAIHPVRFVVDTGFNGYLSVTSHFVRLLNLEAIDVRDGILADGRRDVFETVDLVVNWLDVPRRIRAQVLGEPMLGTRLLNGCQIHGVWKPGSEITISKPDVP